MKKWLALLSCIIPILGFSQNRTTVTTMAIVKGGSYIPLYSKNAQKSEVKSFQMDIYPVTNVDYLKFVRAIRNGKRVT